MKYLIGITLSIIFLFCIQFLSENILKKEIPEFIYGWLCCMAYHIGIKIYELYKQD